MPFSIIKGTFHIKGYSPDGDSIRFQADDRNLWANLSGPPAKLNAKGHAQLRLEAIDTLETHFLNFHQPSAFAIKALDSLLRSLGIDGVVWNDLMTTVEDANDGTAGYIIARTVEPNRRPVSFVFAGAPPEADGSTIFLDSDRLRQSVNYQQIQAGLAYPTYYKGLFPDLRDTLTAAVQAARQANLEIWGEDRTNAGFDVVNLLSITDDHVILPKLFRRLAEYLQAGGDISGFLDFLKSLEEGVVIVSTAHFTHFDTVVRVEGNTVWMTEVPENLVFEG